MFRAALIALDRPIGELLPIAMLFATPVALGIALVALARWARRRNKQLNLGVVRDADIAIAVARRQWREAARLHFLSDLPHRWEQAGRMLALIVVVAMLGLFAVIIVLVLRAISQA